MGRRSMTRTPPCLRSPLRQPVPAELGPPAEPTGDRREPAFERGAQAGLGAEMIYQDDLAARPQHAHEFIQRRFRDPAPR